MKTIEERAEIFADELVKVGGEYYSAKDGYIKGATDQQKLDNEQLCEMILDNQNAMVDKACEWLEENAYLFVNDNIGSLNEKNLIEQFRKAMKGE